ncbi:hypothetical protein GCM10027396_00560 [Insolitispirillum peregrinum]
MFINELTHDFREDQAFITPDQTRQKCRISDSFPFKRNKARPAATIKNGEHDPAPRSRVTLKEKTDASFSLLQRLDGIQSDEGLPLDLLKHLEHPLGHRIG